MEQLTAKIWMELLDVKKISRYDHFFDLGGHSLLAFSLASQLEEKLNLSIPVGLIFEFPILQKYCASLEKITAELLPPVIPVERNQPIPLSFGQERLWHRLPAEFNNYRVSYQRVFLGNLDTGALKKSILELVRRHEILRTIFPCKNGKPYQHILPPESIDLKWIDLTELSEEKTGRGK